MQRATTHRPPDLQWKWERLGKGDLGGLLVAPHNFSLLLIAVANEEAICRATLCRGEVCACVAVMIAGVAREHRSHNSNSCQVFGLLLPEFRALGSAVCVKIRNVLNNQTWCMGHGAWEFCYMLQVLWPQATAAMNSYYNGSSYQLATSNSQPATSKLRSAKTDSLNAIFVWASLADRRFHRIWFGCKLICKSSKETIDLVLPKLKLGIGPYERQCYIYFSIQINLFIIFGERWKKQIFQTDAMFIIYMDRYILQYLFIIFNLNAFYLNKQNYSCWALLRFAFSGTSSSLSPVQSARF